MATLYTHRRVIVVTAATQALANQNAKVADATGWANEWIVPLRKAGDASNTVVAYWTQWSMTEAMRQALDNALANAPVHPKPTAAELHVYELGEALPLLSDSSSTPQRIVICDSIDGQWNPDDVLAALGLDRIGDDGP